MGYAGGTTPDPTYQDIGDHSETIEITYDPALLGYGQLLEMFWAGHDPDVGSRQYASIIFTHDEDQRRMAEQSRAAQESGRGKPLQTEILPAGIFTEAEAYHQKYYLQTSRDLLWAARELLPAAHDLVRSTLAARLNAAAGGQLSREALEEDLSLLGVRPGEAKALLDALPRGR